MMRGVHDNMRGRRTSNQHGNIVAQMPSTTCEECGTEVREGPQPKDARTMVCRECQRPCWYINHARLGYVRGAVPCEE